MIPHATPPLDPMNPFNRYTDGGIYASNEAADHIEQLIRQNEQENRHRYNVDDYSTSVEKIGIVGAGFMGSLIATAAASAGIAVAIQDRDESVLARLPDSLQRWVTFNRSNGTGPDQQVADRIHPTHDLAEVAACPFIIESVVEKLAIKQQVYSAVEVCTSEDAIMASNTSTLPISELAKGIQQQHRFCGLHFFVPSGKPMVEIIPGRQTDDTTIAAALKFADQIGHLPLVVPDGLGFLVNRPFLAYMSAGMRLLMAGIAIERIEQAATDFGMRIGPIGLYDEIGLDVALNSGWSLAAELDTLAARSPVHVRLVKQKQLGWKTGRGFFIHTQDDGGLPVGSVNPLAAKLIADNVESHERLSDAEITDAIILPMVLEATRLLAEGRARDAGQIDLAVTFGFGFPAARGGLLYWADQQGATELLDRLQPLTRLGKHLEPTKLLLAMAKDSVRFYGH